MKALWLKTAFFLLASCLPAVSSVITFDDIPAGVGSTGKIPSGYSGLNWSDGFALLPPASYFGSPPILANGYSLAVVSGPNVAYNTSEGALSIFSTSTFTFNSVFMTAAWDDDVHITVTGSLKGVFEDTKTVILSATAPTLFTFDWSGIDNVTFTPSGGTHHPGYDGGYYTHSGPMFVMDNLDVVTAVPEPSSGVLLTLAIIALACSKLFVRWSSSAHR